jgi:hypothetical protein
MLRRCLAGIITAGALLAPAQDAIHLGSIGGRIVDGAGAVVQGADITARQTETNVTRNAVSDADGRFRVPYLRPGTWEVRVTHPGFAESKRTMALTAGAAYDLSFALALETSETRVDVHANAAVLETARSQVAGTVGETEVRSLPLNGRNFLDLALLIPGVAPTNTGSTQLFAETSAVPGQGLSVGSQRNFSNNFIVDGLSANDDAAGLSGMFFGLDTVQELQVVTSGGQAELGRALGGFISVVTRSGTNELHGDLYGFFRNQRFNAANPLSHAKLPATQAQYGATLGGPVIQDRTFFFGNIEERRLNQSGLTTISPANVAAINSRLDAAGFTGRRISTGLYPNLVRLTNVLGKIDHSIGRIDQFTARYSLYDVESRNSRGAGGLSAATASSDLENTDGTLALGNVLTLSPRTVNETRAQFTRSRLLAMPSDLAGPSVSILGVASFGRLASSPTNRENTLTEIVNNTSHQAGAHAVRAGANFLHNRTTIEFPRAVRGSYTFSSLANFLQGAYNNAGFTQTFGNSSVDVENPNIGLYVQDEWKVRRSLTLNAGVRYDLQFLPRIATDRNNVSPRAGLAWSPGNSGRLIVRGGFGLYYDRIPLRALANALLSSNNTTSLNSGSQIGISLAPTQTGAPVFPQILTSPPPGVLVNFTTMDPRMQNAYSIQASLQVERQIGAHTVVSAGYQHLRGVRLIVAINQNVPTCAPSGNNNGCRPNPAYANNSQYRAQADSRYDGLHLSLVQRPSQWSAFRVSYTYSKSLNNVGEFFFSSPVDPSNIWRDYGRSDDDQRHRLVVNGTLNTPRGHARTLRQKLSHGFEIGAFLQYYSELPLNVTSGVTTIQGTVGRPVVNGDFIPRNAGTGADFFSLNARASRQFHVTERVRLEAIAEAFNALNRRNVLTKNGVFGTGAYPSNPAAAFGQVTAVHDPRSLQFALRVRF